MSVFRDDRHLLADHRAHRQRRGPPHRRVEPDGGRPAPGWLARERDHSAAGARWCRRSRSAVSAPTGSGPHDLVDARVADHADARVSGRLRWRARLNVIVSGGTGAGKTTLLNILSGFIGHKERVITIEDAAELMLRQRHVVRLETRPSNIEGKGGVRQRELVVNALRMRPDRIIVGEVEAKKRWTCSRP